MSSRLHNAAAPITLGLLCVSLLFNSRAIAGNGGGPAIAPPNSHTYGQSMAEWLVDYTLWKNGSAPTGASAKVLFVSPLVSDAPSGSGTLEDPLVFSGEGEIAIKPGTALLDVLIAWWGELYPDGTIDPMLPGDWWGTYVTGEARLDRKPVLHDVADYYITPQVFDQPLLYSQPTPWGSIGTAFVQGVPIILPPLSVGVHIYETVAYVLVPPDNGVTAETAVIFRNSRKITVAK